VLAFLVQDGNPQLICHLNYPARKPSSSVAGRLRLQVIRFLVDDHRFVQDGICSLEGKPAKYTLKAGHTLFVRIEIPEIADMLLGIRRGTVFRASGIEMSSSGCEIGGRAITFFVDMKTVLPRRQAFHIRRDSNTLSFFGEGYLPSHFAVWRWA
jgi:hypothetical protein